MDKERTDEQSTADVVSQDDASCSKEAESGDEKCVVNLTGVDDSTQNIVYVKIEEVAPDSDDKNCEVRVTEADSDTPNVIYVNIEDVCPESVLTLVEGVSEESGRAVVIEGSISNAVSNELEDRSVSTQPPLSARDEETVALVQDIVLSNGTFQSEMADEQPSTCPDAEGSGDTQTKEEDLVGDQGQVHEGESAPEDEDCDSQREGQSQFQCAICMNSYASATDYMDHVSSHIQESLPQDATPSSKSHKCNKCGKGFKKKKYLKAHLSLTAHSDQKKYRCEICNTGFTRRYRFVSHMENRHAETASSEYECSICMITFANKSTYNRHWAAHFKLGNIKKAIVRKRSHFCGKCGKGFLKSGHLREHHLSAHSGLRRNWCQICDKGFTRPSKLQRHLKTVHHISEDSPTENSISQPSVSEKNENDEEGSAHQMSTGDEVSPTKLPGDVSGSEPDGKGEENSGVDEEMVRNDAKGDSSQVKLSEYTCPACRETFSSVADYSIHCSLHFPTTKDENTATDKPQYTCNECGKGFWKKSHFTDHLDVHTGQKKHKCKVCEKSFARPGRLKVHMERNHRCPERKSSDFTCSICDNTFANNSTFSRHWASHFNEGSAKKKTMLKRSHICEQCGKGFLKSGHLREHNLSAHSGLKRNWCKICNRGFTRPSKLRRHLESIHHTSANRKQSSRNVQPPTSENGGVAKRLHVCNVCGKYFMKKKHLAGHLAVHFEQKKNTVCEICGKHFSRPCRLRKHMASHPAKDNKGDLKCSICKNTFSNKSTYTRHLESHSTGSSPRSKDVRKRSHICGQCGKGFLQKSHLREHMYAHLGITMKRNQCEICDKGFTRPSKLKRHMENIHQISPKDS